jgi:tetratricopeptide (TPR) repeat protein
LVADARAMQGGRRTAKENPDAEREFRGSWSGYERDKLFHNPDGAFPRFLDAAYVTGLDLEDDGRAAVPVDIDGDGDLDLVLHSLQGLRLMINRSPRRHFARLRLRATAGEPLALGAVARVSSGGIVQQDYVRITDGFLAQVPLDLHFGLGDTPRIERVEVDWPSGRRDSWLDVPADALVELVEGDPVARSRPLPCWPASATAVREAPTPGQVVAPPLGGGERRALVEPGKAAIVNFWSPTCAPCVRELPSLARLSSAFAGEASFSGVCVDSADLEAANRLLSEAGVVYPQFAADDSLMRTFFGESGAAPLPSTFVFDARGRLRRLFPRAISEPDLSELLASFRSEAVSAADLELRGRGALARRDFAAAEELLLKAEASSPGSASRWVDIGLARLGARRSGEAAAAFEKAVQLDPGEVQGLVNLGTARVEQGRVEEALDLYRRALAIRGEDAELLVNLGNAAAIANRLPAAHDAFQRACRADPQSAAAWTGLGKLLLAQNKPGEAAAALRRAIETGGDAREAEALLRKLGATRR